MAAGVGGARFRVLGRLEAEVGGRPVALGGPRIRVLLALLLADAGRPVSMAALIDGLWGPQPPADAERTVRTYVSRLRKALLPVGPEAEHEPILTRSPGYLLRIEPDTPDVLDALGFQRLVADGRRALLGGRAAEAAGLLSTALELWRGPAYQEFGEVAALHAEAERLERLRRSAVYDRIEADLGRGRGPELVTELEELAARHPGHERLCGQLMIALYRAGRPSDALAAYRRIRRLLVAEAGLEPSPALAEIHQRVLAQDPRLLPLPTPDATAAGTGPPGPGHLPRPAQLPRPVRGFTGRRAALAALDAVLPTAGRAAAGAATVVLSSVSGTAGVGKTALAVHWAHRVADRFPEGQFYVNLRGFDPGGQVLEPAEALRGFLDALGVPAGRIPPDLDAQAALYRSLLDGRRTLVVLDNARDAEQVRPLLPGTASAVVVITSRNQLAGLVATDGAVPITLDPLTGAEARDLLAARLGPARPAAEPAAVDRIVERCARLPLALAIAAARAATATDLPLSKLAGELADSADRLDALDAGEPAARVRAVFSWSYRALRPPAARLFRLLGLHPGPDLGTAAAAALAGLPVAAVRPLLAELTEANLLTERTTGRFSFHDLLRAYAADLTRADDTDDARRAATTRMLDHAMHTACAASRVVDAQRDPPLVPLGNPVPGAAVETPADRPAALAWLTAEQPGLPGLLTLAADVGQDPRSWLLAWAWDLFLQRRGEWPLMVRAWQAAVSAADRLGADQPRVYARRMIAGTAVRLGRYDTAHEHLRQALELCLRAGDEMGQAYTQMSLAYLCERQGRPADALTHAQQANVLFGRADHRRGQATSLNAIGWCHSLLGDHGAALACCEQALTLHRDLGDRQGEAHTLDSLGHAHHHLHQHRRAAERYRQALALYRDLGDRYNEAATLHRLGDTRHAAAEPAAARTAWRDALVIFVELDHPDAAELRRKLDDQVGAADEGRLGPAHAGTSDPAGGAHP